ncbi:hypothetical protein HDV06_004701 [Boothiomyces sp. JEL0866]|nr:hypothetical protein HDV06_004701 [Boothiomyces sp. JEL0866]
MGKLIYLEAIRGLAALMVALHHFDLGITDKNQNLSQLKVKYPILKLFTDGNLAVTIFFILSGRVLTLSFLKRELSPTSFENLSSSVFKRSFRLVVPVLVVLLISQLLGYFGLNDSVGVANIITGTKDWYQPPTEFQSFKEICYVLGTDTWYYLFYKYTRDLYQTTSGTIDNPGGLWYQPQDSRIFLGACIILFVESTPILQTILNTPIFDFLGKISFGLYLVHGVVLSTVISKVVVSLIQSGHTLQFTQIISFLVFWVLSITFGWIIYKFVDMPSVRLSKRIRTLFIRRVPAPLERIVVPSNLPE